MGLYIPWAAAFSGELSMPLRNTTTDLMDAVKEAKGIESDYGLAKLLAVELVAKSMETAVAAACMPAQMRPKIPLGRQHAQCGADTRKTLATTIRARFHHHFDCPRCLVPDEPLAAQGMNWPVSFELEWVGYQAP